MSDDSDYELEHSRNNSNNIGLYEGDRNELGERHGHGNSHFENGDVYQGEYMNGKRQGVGSYRFKNAKYEGEYVKGKRNGEGTMHYPDGSIYKGQWEDGDKNGIGTYTYPNGDTYEGEWKNDQKHGKGIYMYQQTGAVFKGHWVEGIREGQAEWFNDGHSYKGFFREDHPFGRGRFVFPNGCEQHGFYKVTNLMEHAERGLEMVGREAQWTCTALIRSPPKNLEQES